ncbi:hypothetical protein FOL47_011377, partial [Perkinsus chesapeaki]
LLSGPVTRLQEQELDSCFLALYSITQWGGNVESIKLLRRQVKELKMELARTKGPESAQEMEKRLRMQEMEQRYTSLENTVRDLRSLLSEQLNRTTQAVQQAGFQVKEQERVEKAKRPKNPFFCVGRWMGTVEVGVMKTYYRTLLYLRALGIAFLRGRHGADDVCEFCETRKARYLGSEPSLAAGPPRSGQIYGGKQQGRYQDLLSEMQNTLLSYQQSLVDMLSQRKEDLKKKENDNNDVVAEEEGSSRVVESDELKEAQDRRKGIEEAEKKKMADKAAAAKELEDEYNKAKKDYDKLWGKSADLSPRTLALASANEGRTAAEAAAKQQAEAQQKAKEQEEKAKSFERQARKAAGGGDQKSDGKAAKKSSSNQQQQKATTTDKSKLPKGGKGKAAAPSVESDSEDSDDSDVLARVMARGDGEDQDLAANVQMAELRRHQQAEIEKQQNTLNEQRQAIEEQKAELLKLQESLKAQLVPQGQQPPPATAAVASSSGGDDGEEEDDDDEERPGGAPRTSGQQQQSQWTRAPPAPVAPGPPAKGPVYQTSMQSTGSWVPGRPDDRERYNQQQGGGVPVVNAVLVPPEKVVDGQQGGDPSIHLRVNIRNEGFSSAPHYRVAGAGSSAASSPSYAAVASGASAAPPPPTPPQQRYAPQGYQMPPPDYYQQQQGGYTIPQAQVPMPPPRNLRVPTPDLPQRQQQQQNAPPQGYAQPAQQAPRPATVTTPSPPRFPRVPFVGARKTSTRTSSGDATRQQQQVPPPQPSRPAAAAPSTPTPVAPATEPSRVPGLRRKLTGNLSAAKGWPGAETQAAPADSEFKWPQQQ